MCPRKQKVWRTLGRLSCLAWGTCLMRPRTVEQEATCLSFSDEDFRGRRQEVPKVEEALREGQ